MDTTPTRPTFSLKDNHRVSRRTRIAGTVAVVAIVVAGLVIGVVASGVLGPKPSLSGSLVMQIAGGWEAPSGETVSGIVEYHPSTGEVLNVFGPNLKSVTFRAFSPGASSALGQQTGASSTALVLVSRATQSVTRVLARAEAGDTLVFPVLSGDGSKIAFVRIPSLEGLPPDPSGNPYPFSPTDDPILRLEPGLALPAAYLPQLQVAVAGGSTLLSLGNLRPLAFSPDGASLLLYGADGFQVVSLSGGALASAAGINTGAFTEGTTVQASWDGSKIAVVDAGTGAAELFSFDWAAGTFVSLGSVRDEGSVPVLGASGSLLLHTLGDQEVQVYDLASGTHTRSYSLDIPDGVRIIDWTSL